MTQKRLLVRWTLANAVGMSLGFLTFLQTLMFLTFGLDFDLHWSAEAVEAKTAEVGSEADRLNLIYHMIALPTMGAVLATFQAWILRDRLSRIWQWILCWPAGFVTVSLVIWSLREVWGDIPGPVEPFLILGVGLLAGGLLQWLLLRRRGIHATRWLVLWTLGMPLGMAVYLLVNTIIHFGLVVPGVLDTISWALDVTTIGFCIGGTAAAISGKALFRAISPDAPPPATSQSVGQR